MKIKIIFAMFLFAALLGAGNNLFNSNRVPWLGSSELLPKPEGWPSLTIKEGVAGGLKVAKSDLKQYSALVGGALLFLALFIRVASRLCKPVSGGIKTWLRIVLGVMFLFAAYPKFTDPKDFAMLVTQYQILPTALVNLFSMMLPAFEITTGLALIFTPFEREASAAVLLLLVMFVTALSSALSRNLGIACGCFDIEGAADAGETWFSILRDIVLLIPVTWMLFKARTRYLWDF